MQGTVYDKARMLKESLMKEFPKLQERDLFHTLAKLATWHYPKKRTKKMKLSKVEAMVYEFMINNQYHPSTCYKWFLACSTNEDVQERLKNGSISMKDAMKHSKPFKTLSQVEAQFLYEVKLAIRRYVIR